MVHFRNIPLVAKINFRMIVMALVIGLVAVSCKKDDQGNIILPEDFFMFGVKSGKVVYEFTNSDYETQTLIFDDYGKRMRLERAEYDVVIFDAIAEKAYEMSMSDKTYNVIPYSNTYATAAVAGFIYLGDDVGSVWQYYSGFKKESNQTIAGKNCTVYSWSADGEKVTWGGWKRLTFLYKTTYNAQDYDYGHKAISFTESIPANSFAPPADYTNESDNKILN